MSGWKEIINRLESVPAHYLFKSESKGCNIFNATGVAYIFGRHNKPGMPFIFSVQQGSITTAPGIEQLAACVRCTENVYRIANFILSGAVAIINGYNSTVNRCGGWSCC